MNILMVEDDLDLSGALSGVLAGRGIQVLCCADGLEALALARRRRFDAILLDLTLPGIDGLEVLQRMRDGNLSTPVLVVTARGEVSDRVMGLNIGADDYLSKPFDVDELEARLRVLVRRHRGEEDMRCGSLRRDRHTGVIYNGLRPLDVSPREAGLLKALLQRRGQAMTKEALRDAVFGNEAGISLEAVDVVVHRVRKRIAGAAVELVTLRGVGYLLIDEALVPRDP